MVTGVEAHQRQHQQTEDADKLAASASRGGGPSYQDFSGGGGAHSASTSGSEPAATAPASDGTFPRLDVHGDDAGFPHGAVSGKKKKRGARAVGADKSGRGLRQFSMKVCEKVESKGRTTYNEVADKLVAEFADPSTNLETPDQQQYDEKNIRRRVYDALNVLMAMDIIAKDKKEIQWKGLPRMNLNDIEELKAEHIALRSRIDKKRAYLQELEDQVLKSWYSGTSSCMDQEMHLQVEWHCLLFLFRLNHMLLLRLKYQRICSWSISTLIALLSSCMMTPMFSRQ